MHCLKCRTEMVRSKIDHPYQYDRRKTVTLRDLEQHACTWCDYSEVAIPKMGPLHESIKQALAMFMARRFAMLFENWPSGVSDGAWGVVLFSSAQRG